MTDKGYDELADQVIEAVKRETIRFAKDQSGGDLEDEKFTLDEYVGNDMELVVVGTCKDEGTFSMSSYFVAYANAYTPLGSSGDDVIRLKRIIMFTEGETTDIPIKNDGIRPVEFTLPVAVLYIGHRPHEMWLLAEEMTDGTGAYRIYRTEPLTMYEIVANPGGPDELVPGAIIRINPDDIAGLQVHGISLTRVIAGLN